MPQPTELDALYAFLVAALVTALLTPVTMWIARAVGVIDEPRQRGLSDHPTPLLGGLAIFAGALVAGLIWLPAGYARDKPTPPLARRATCRWVHHAGGCARRPFRPPTRAEAIGQVLAAVIVVHFGVAVKAITLPFVGTLHSPMPASPTPGRC